MTHLVLVVLLTHIVLVGINIDFEEEIRESSEYKSEFKNKQLGSDIGKKTEGEQQNFSYHACDVWHPENIDKWYMCLKNKDHKV